MRKLQNISCDWQDPDINSKLEYLIANANCIDLDDFEDSVDLECFLDESESFQSYADQDEDVVFFETEVSNNKILGIRHMGTIDLFSASGYLPDLSDVKPDQSSLQLEMDALAWVLSKRNSPNAVKHTGTEDLRYETSKVRCFTNNDTNSARYQLMSKGEPVAAIFVKDNVIDSIYVSVYDFREKGLGRKLSKIAKKDFPGLEHSDSNTVLGRKFIAAVDLEQDFEMEMS